MKKITLSLLAATLISLPLSSFAGDSDASLMALKNQIFDLQSSQDNFDKQFKNAYKEIKKVEAQLPKLNEDVQAQLKQLQENNNKMMKEVRKFKRGQRSEAGRK